MGFFMSAIWKLHEAREVLESEIVANIIASEFNSRFKRLSLTLSDATRVFVQFNDHDEYSYSIVFSALELDRIRFDNHDTVWNVPSKPHHVHLRHEEEGRESPMCGNPAMDMTILVEAILDPGHWTGYTDG